MPLPQTPGHTQKSLAHSLVGSLLFFFFPLGPGAHKVLFVPFKSLFPQSYASSVIKSHWPSRSNSLGFSVPFPDLQVGKSVAGPRTCTTVRELLWDNCSPVCGLSAQWLCGGAHTPHLPGVLEPEPLFLQQASADLCFCRRHSDTQRQGPQSRCGVSGSWCTQGFV